jgi:hypothetical protein
VAQRFAAAIKPPSISIFVIPSHSKPVKPARVSEESAFSVTTDAFGCTKLVYTGVIMPSTKRARPNQVRRSITLPPRIAKQVETIAKQRALSDNRVLVELIEQGIQAAQQKEKAFFQLAERFRAASDPEQVKQLGDELGRFVFGE